LGIKHKKELQEYFKKRQNAFREILPVGELYGIGHIVQNQIHGLQSALNQLEERIDDDTKLENIRLFFSRGSLHSLKQDVESILSTGKQVLPDSLSELKAFLGEQARKRWEAERAEYQERRRLEKEKAQKEAEESKRQQQDAELDRLGLRDIVAKLRS